MKPHYELDKIINMKSIILNHVGCRKNIFGEIEFISKNWINFGRFDNLESVGAE